MATKPKAPRFAFLTSPETDSGEPSGAAQNKAAQPSAVQTRATQTPPEVVSEPLSSSAEPPSDLPPEQVGAALVGTNPASAPQPLPATDVPNPLPAAADAPMPVPSAPSREERRAFSTRLKPSLKRSLDAFVMELKMAGWPVSQELVLEELVRRLRDDETLRAAVTAQLTGPGREV
ncbi:hypothetical protein [Deinococcus sp.]|uniref:hypothetical protein n=1 Tax=Deinococcus sp. TaxID=47478 RepID=UPI003CC58877